ncbi:hypothetical protein BDR05DRAFT_976597 [Suillus weaverae]|nr:hypothetical protein BDR05DRAFT_976597 [Suillus weaverae]
MSSSRMIWLGTLTSFHQTLLHLVHQTLLHLVHQTLLHPVHQTLLHPILQTLLHPLERSAILPKHTDAIAFVKLLQEASLDDPVAKLDDAALTRLCNPYQTCLEIDSRAVQHRIATYFALGHSAIDAYKSIRRSAMHCLEGEATQIPNICVVFIGSFANLEHCPICNTEHYDPIKLRMSGGQMHVACQKFGSEYIQAVQWGDIKPDDLYESKLLDCWIYIWVIMNHAPDRRYKKKYVLPGGFIPGPNKPKNINSFLFPGMHHLAALQNEVYFDGMVGHSGKNGCRMYYGLLGCRKGTHYYPVLLVPHHYDLLNDLDVTEYFDNLIKLYRKLRTETGIMKPSLLLGLQPTSTLSIPNYHPSMWPWAVFHDVETWEIYGEAVSYAAQHLPGLFDRKPRNPAEKINPGYKTWEYQVYIFGLGPALLYNILPRPYWLNYCKLHSISLNEACWELDFEILYYQHRADCLHFICPCMVKKGPPICYSQWTMEHTINNLRQEIRQPSNPYANLSWEGAMIPDSRPIVPQGPAAEAIFRYLGHQHNIKIRQWASCTAWRETLRPPEKLRPSRHVKAGLDVWIWDDVAVISMFSLPDQELLDLSCLTVSLCRHDEDDDVRVIDLKSILSVIGMVPHQPTLPSGVTEDRFFVVEKPGLDIATFGVPYEGDTAQDDQYDE